MIILLLMILVVVPLVVKTHCQQQQAAAERETIYIESVNRLSFEIMDPPGCVKSSQSTREKQGEEFSFFQGKVVTALCCWGSFKTFSLFCFFFCRRRWSDKVFCACEGCDSISGVGSSRLRWWLVELNRQGWCHK